MTAELYEDLFLERKRKLANVRQRIDKLDKAWNRGKLLTDEMGYLTSRHYLECERNDLINLIESM